MKQTNNAIKFLMAQYRAIFQNAYFKGLATAAVVTMGLAAGQAQAAKDAPYTGAETINGTEITITGDNQTDPATTPGSYSKLNVTADNSKNFDKNITIQSGAKASNYVSGSAGEITFTANNLTISAKNKTDGLTVTGAEDKAATVNLNQVLITKGDLTLAGHATNGTATLNATKISLSGASAGDAILTVGANTIAGYDLADKGAANEKPAAGQPFDLANYTNLDLAKNGKLAVAAAATTGGAIVNAGKLSITGGSTVVVESGGATSDTAVINLVSGVLNDGTITTSTNNLLKINFASGDFIDSGNDVKKEFTLTSGTLTLAGGITLSGEGKLVVTDDLTKLKVTGDAGITLADKAAYAPKDVDTAKAVAGKLPIKIGANGVLDFGSTAANLSLIHI